MITRKQYLNKEVTHRQYYAQFVTPRIKQEVAKRFGVEKLAKAFAVDENLNNIDLRHWDALSMLTHNILRRGHDEGGWTLCFNTCVLKEAARQVIEENN
jgi:hypothetical protein